MAWGWSLMSALTLALSVGLTCGRILYRRYRTPSRITDTDRFALLFDTGRRGRLRVLRKEAARDTILRTELLW